MRNAPQLPADPRERCGLYVHIPFCSTKCGYCDFYSVPLKNRKAEPLVAAVEKELRRRVGADAASVETVFVGGGTPTLLDAELLSRLLGTLVAVGATRDVLEFTVEANPATIDDRKARVLIDNGVTRVSMGAQSFFPAELATLERIHSPDDIPPSVETLRRAGVGGINLDLIFGIPGQTMSTWGESLRRTIDLGVDHIACYGLMYEPGTRLTAMRKHGRITPCDEGVEADLYLQAIDVLEGAGYTQYEISNFARPGCACRHNLKYWRNEPYIGVGPSAVGWDGRVRYRNVPDERRYVNMINQSGDAETESETIDTSTLIHEMILMQLRLVEGICLAAFRRRIGVDALALFAEPLRRLTEIGVIGVSDTHLALTRKGRLVADAVMTELAVASESLTETPAQPAHSS